MLFGACGFSARRDAPGGDTVGSDAIQVLDAAMNGPVDADVSRPMIVATNPTASSVGVSRTTVIVVTFSEAVQNVDGTTFTLKMGSTPVAATVTMNTPSIHQLAPNATLPANTTFTFFLASAITDTSGNTLPSMNYTFTTGT